MQYQIGVFNFNLWLTLQILETQYNTQDKNYIALSNIKWRNHRCRAKRFLKWN